MWQGIESGAVFQPRAGGEPVSVRDHLASRGVTELGDCDPRVAPRPGTFEAQVKKVEDDFWGRRFRATHAWKRDWWEAYQRSGGFSILTGFRVQNFHKRNDTINYPSQAVAFHWLLQVLIWLQRWLDREGMETLILGEIHDSGLLDCPPGEVRPVIAKAVELITRALPERWPWICVPLLVEAEVAPVDASWYDKQKVELP